MNYISKGNLFFIQQFRGGHKLQITQGKGKCINASNNNKVLVTMRKDEWFIFPKDKHRQSGKMMARLWMVP